MTDSGEGRREGSTDMSAAVPSVEPQGPTRYLSPEWAGRDELQIAGEIAAICAALFDDDELRISPGDNFFALGGSSLLALDLVRRLENRFTIRLSLLTIIDAEDMTKLAIKIRDTVGDARAPGITDVEEGVL